MPAPTDPAAAVDEALSRHDHQRTALVQILRDVQSRTRWLPREVLRRIADGVGLTPAIVEGVAGFYRFFHLQPVGRVHLLFSDNVTDRMLGSRALAADLCARLGVEPGQVAADGSGHPVAGAWVLGVDLADGSLTGSVTGADGAYSVTLPPGSTHWPAR